MSKVKNRRSIIIYMKLKFCIFIIPFVLFSCNDKKKLEKMKTFGTEITDYVASAEKDLFVSDSVKISGDLSLDNIEYLYVYIDNKSNSDIQLDSSYYIACDTLLGKHREIFRENQNSAALIRQGERKKICVNLKLDEIKYSSNIPYSFNIFYSIKRRNDTHLKLSYQFYTPTMWKEKNGSITLMLDTIIND